jgi:hypothetical protein
VLLACALRLSNTIRLLASIVLEHTKCQVEAYLEFYEDCPDFQNMSRLLRLSQSFPADQWTLRRLVCRPCYFGCNQGKCIDTFIKDDGHRVLKAKDHGSSFATSVFVGSHAGGDAEDHVMRQERVFSDLDRLPWAKKNLALSYVAF